MSTKRRNVSKIHTANQQHSPICTLVSLDNETQASKTAYYTDIKIKPLP